MLATENLRDGATPDPRRTARPSSADADGPRVCVTRTDDGARFETTVGGQSSSEQTIIADGTTRPVSDTECSGTTRSEWSKSSLRLFSTSEVRCQGEAEQRRVSGLRLLAPNGDWLDIQTVAVGGRETISVKRYYRDTTSPRPAFQSVAASVFTLAEVKDAIGKVSTAAIEAALVETGAGFNLSTKSLKDLHSAGVPERIIDLVVALSYPEKFVVQRAVHAAPPPIYRDPFGPGWSYGYPYYYDRYYGSPYFYEPFGWRGYSVFESSVIYVETVGGGSGGSVPNGPGRAVNGLGYTRITNRDSFPTASATANPASTSGSSSRSSSSSGSSGGASVSSSGGYSSGGSSDGGSSSGGGSSSSSGGSSGSGSSDSGGRTAVPR
jgi:hypothetical protein